MLGSGIEEAAPVLEVVSALGLFWGETVLDALRGETASDPSDGGWVMAASTKRRLLAGALVEAVTLGAIAAGRALSGDETAGGPATAGEGARKLAIQSRSRASSVFAARSASV